MTTLIQDLKYGARALRRNPGVAAAAIVAMALGIGANTAIFSQANAVLLHPLPFKELDRLVMVYGEKREENESRRQVSQGDINDWREQNHVFESLAGYAWWEVNLTGVEGAYPENLQGFLVTPNFFSTLDAEPEIGRTFLPEEDQPGREAVVVLSDVLWRSRFGADPSLVGRSIRLNGAPHTVIGVMPPDFEFPPAGPRLWVPMSNGPEDRSERRSTPLKAFARLRPGVGLAQARSEMSAIAGRLEKLYPATNTGLGVRIVPLLDDVLQFTRPAILLMAGAVGFVLLIACANVANILLARASARRREFAIRAALGAARGRLVRQVLTESLLLSLLGGAVGVFLAMWGVDLMTKAIPSGITRFIPGWNSVAIDAAVLGFTLAVSIVSGLLFGLVPALSISRPDLGDPLQGGTRGAVGTGRRRARSLLVVSEIALALILLTGAGLMVKGFTGQTRSARTGIDAENVLSMQVTLPDNKYTERGRVRNFFDALNEQVKGLPGVGAAGAVTNLPLSGSWSGGRFTIKDRPATRGKELTANYAMVAGDYFTALGIPLVRGRRLTAADNQDAQGVAVISDLMARTFWPGEDPLGRQIRRGGVDSKNPWLTVVGVVSDIRHFGLDPEPKPTMYFPSSQLPQLGMTLVVRTAGDPMDLSTAIRDKIRGIDPEVPGYNIRTMETVVSEATAGPRFTAALLAVLAGIALLLAAVGIYGVTAYSVAQRTREIGVRIALGARTADILRLIVGHGMKLTLIASAIGLAGSVALARALSALPFGISASDPATFAGTTLCLAAVALAACYLPARRAAKVDPVVALRNE